MNRLLVPSSALLWGLQASFLSPALALIMVSLYGASTAEVGWVLSIYNASGFVFALLLPAWADRHGDYLRPMALCGALTGALAAVLGVAHSLPIATLALVVLGGPAGVGSSLLFAHLRHAGGSAADVVNTRAIVSVAWVAGPPISTAIIAGFGSRAVLLAIVAVAVLNVATTAIMLAHARRRPDAGVAATRLGHRAVHEHSPARFDRVRTDHRGWLAHGARRSRNLRRVLGSGAGGAGRGVGRCAGRASQCVGRTRLTARGAQPSAASIRGTAAAGA